MNGGSGRMNIKMGITVFAVVAGLAFLAYFAGLRQSPVMDSDHIQVVASFYPLAEFARQAGGSLVQVTTVVPAHSEPHEYEPTPQELAGVYGADIFIYNGGGFDPWAERVAPELAVRGVTVIAMSEHMTPIANPILEGEEAHEAEGAFDPHFWLDPVLAQEQVHIISEALARVDSVNAAAYARQGNAYITQLQALDHEYKQGLSMCNRRDIVTSHAAAGYLAKRYDLTPITIAGISPEEEPSARTLSEIAKLAQQRNVKYIFFETLVSPKLAQTVASEIGAGTLVLDPIEGVSNEDQQNGKTYITIMQENLQNLRIALECK